MKDKVLTLKTNGRILCVNKLCSVFVALDLDVCVCVYVGVCVHFSMMEFVR